MKELRDLKDLTIHDVQPISTPPGVIIQVDLSTYRGTSLIRKRPPLGPTVGLCLGPYGGPMGWEFSYERGTPAPYTVM